jgi:hypothetical protein
MRLMECKMLLKIGMILVEEKSESAQVEETGN